MTVVLPASMWAMMPMLRIFVRAVGISLISFKNVARGYRKSDTDRYATSMNHLGLSLNR